MKVSSKNFDFTHLNELKRFTKNQAVVHFVSSRNSNLENFKNISEVFEINEDENYFELIKNLEKKYELIVITDLFELTDNIYGFLMELNSKLSPNGKLLVISVNPKWNYLLNILEKLNLKKQTLKRSYIHPKKINNIARSVGFEMTYSFSRQIFPFKVFGLGLILNNILEFLTAPFNLGIKNYMMFANSNNIPKKYSKSIIVPAKNEEKNLIPLITRIPNFKEETEIVVVYGDSKDKTEEIANNLPFEFKERNFKIIKQSGNGKSGAVWEGLEKCSNDLIAILDSDLSVDPESLNDFFNILENGHADFVNGTRLIYPMEKSAMRLINTFGNKIFQFLISKIIGQKLTDSLCGTKVFKKRDIDKIHFWQNQISYKDPFGDFDLLFSSAYSGSKIVEYPVHYRARVYGETQISRFKDGLKLIRYMIKSYFLFNISKKN